MQKTANPNATKEAQELLNFLSGTAGKQLITGQHTQTNAMEEITYIRERTGKEPFLRGFELLAYSPNINYQNATEECLTEVYENRNTVETALEWAGQVRGQGIVTLSFHWFSPLGGRDKSFYSQNTDFNPEAVLVEGSPERAAFYHDMDVIAVELSKFQAASIPVLWRPFHEADGDWFWWGSKGPVVASRLYCLMFDYYTNVLHLNHLLWVWNCPIKEAYPGDDFVDVISMDIYLAGYEATDYGEQYKQLRCNTTQTKVAALAEVGYIPDIKKIKESHVPWAYYMTWSKEFCIGEQYNTTEKLCEMYDSEYALVRKFPDESHDRRTVPGE